jgi:hypothetical protein
VVEQLARVNADDVEVERTMEDWRSVLNPLLVRQILNGRLMQVELVVGVNRINHALGKVPQGFLAMGHVAASTGNISDARDTDPHTKRYLYIRLTTTAATNATVFVY